MIKLFAAFACLVAVALAAATGVQASSPVVTQAESSGQQAGPKDQPTTLQGEK